ncbi:MAG: 7-carboxy-7-deazaguanine synthase QueE [Candidatus Omnitrophota bacterium]
MKARISEIFKSIQGEGVYQGKEQVFVRFFGCNLNCLFCDTKPERYEEKTIEEVIKDISAYTDYHSLSITGGEPLLQIDFLKQLLPRLRASGRRIYLETNGTLYRQLEQVVGLVDIIAMDFKLPSSTGTGEFWVEHKAFFEIALRKEVFVKAVIGCETQVADVTKMLKIINELASDTCLVLQSQYPFEGMLQLKLNAIQALAQESGINARVLGQLHKVLGVR